MNAFLWTLQVLLALHTAIGALWKFSNSSQTVPALQAIPHGIWLTMSVMELLCSAALILPAFMKPLGKLAPVAALLIAVEMLCFVGLQLRSASSGIREAIYWLVVAAISAFLAVGRLALRPL